MKKSVYLLGVLFLCFSNAKAQFYQVTVKLDSSKIYNPRVRGGGPKTPNDPTLRARGNYYRGCFPNQIVSGYINIKTDSSTVPHNVTLFKEEDEK